MISMLYPIVIELYRRMACALLWYQADSIKQFCKEVQGLVTHSAIHTNTIGGIHHGNEEQNSQL